MPAGLRSLLYSNFDIITDSGNAGRETCWRTLHTFA